MTDAPKTADLRPVPPAAAQPAAVPPAAAIAQPAAVQPAAVQAAAAAPKPAPVTAQPAATQPAAVPPAAVPPAAVAPKPTSVTPQPAAAQPAAVPPAAAITQPAAVPPAAVQAAAAAPKPAPVTPQPAAAQPGAVPPAAAIAQPAAVQPAAVQPAAAPKPAPVTPPPAAVQPAAAVPKPAPAIAQPAAAGAGAAPKPVVAAPPPAGPVVPIRPVQPGPAGAVPPVIHTLPTAGPATAKRRHWGILATFVAVVLLPTLISAAYLWVLAKDQYASTVAFSIRKEEFQSSLDLLGGITKLSGGGSSDTDVLYEFIRSQELVSVIDNELDLKAIYSRAWPMDPVFAYDPSGTIEDLLRHWERKVQITYDTGTGLMSLRVLAFDPEEARTIATAILTESTRMINALSAEAREDSTRYAREELERSVERLKQARSDLTAFRLRTRIVDPQADLQGQMGVLNTLQAQLADSMVELDLLRVSARGDDPRIVQTERRIEVIENRIISEREKFGEGGQGPGGEDYATLVAEFERLTVDREFTEQTYRAALVSYDAALAEAQRKSRYLAAHIEPTKAERSAYPQRWTLLALTGFFLLMAWAIGVLIYYSIRDRR